MTLYKLIDILSIQAFWLSFALIGFSSLILLKNKFKSSFFDFFDSLHFIVKTLICFAAGMAVFAAVIIPGVVLKLPVLILAVAYTICLIIAVTTIYHYRHQLRTIRSVIPKNKVIILNLIAILAILGVDYAISLKIGPPLFGDAIVHTAKINQLSSGNFSLADPIFGNGVIESRYHINIPLSLHALASQVLRIDAITVWVYSLAFWRLLMWLALFSLVWAFVDSQKRTRWAYGVLALAPIFYSATFFFASYPGRIVYVWSVVFIIGLLEFLKRKQPWLLLLGCLLIALTHPISSLAAVTFLGLLGFILLIWRKISRRQIIVLAIAGMILIVPVGLSYVFPDRMTEVAAGLEPVLIRRHGPILLGLPERLYKTIDPWVVVGLSLVGYVYLLISSKHKLQKILISLLVIYYGLIVYNPVVLEIIHGRLPAWVIFRFQELNLFGLIAPALGLFFLAETFFIKVVHNKKYLPAVMISLVLLVSGYSLFQLKTIEAFTSFHPEYSRNYASFMILRELKPELTGKRAFADNTLTQPWLPAVTGANVINISETQASPMSNMALRWPCSVQLREKLDPYDLKAAGIDYVVANAEIDPHLAGLAENSPSLLLIKRAGPFALYVVKQEVKDLSLAVETVCSIPYGQ